MTFSIQVADIQWSPGMYKTKYIKKWMVLYKYNIFWIYPPPRMPVSHYQDSLCFSYGDPNVPSCATVVGWGIDPTYIMNTYQLMPNWIIELPSTVWIPYSFSQVRIISLHFKRNDSWVHANKKILPPNIFLSLQWKTTGAYQVITNIAPWKIGHPKNKFIFQPLEFFQG